MTQSEDLLQVDEGISPVISLIERLLIGGRITTYQSSNEYGAYKVLLTTSKVLVSLIGELYYGSPISLHLAFSTPRSDRYSVCSIGLTGTKVLQEFLKQLDLQNKEIIQATRNLVQLSEYEWMETV